MKLSKAELEKYNSMSKNALIQKAAQLDWLMSGIRSALDILRPFATLFLTNPKLKQAFNLIEDIVRDYESGSFYL